MTDTQISLSHQTRKDRHHYGKSLREVCPREKHGVFVKPDRDPLAILATQDASRISHLLPVRYERMAQAPFNFYRGADAIMSYDLAQCPQAGIPVQGAGDSHILNFGAAAAADGTVLFDINDFDETLGNVDFTLDVKRLATSVAIALDDGGASKRNMHRVAASAVRAYRERIRALAKLSPIAIWNSRMDMAQEAHLFEEKKLHECLMALLSSAEARVGSDDNFPHLVKCEGGNLKIQDKPPLIFHFSEENLNFDIEPFFSAYRASLAPERAIGLDRYALRDQAFKVVGVGSVGTFCAIGLYTTGDGDPLFLQIKEAQKSALESVAPGSAWSGPQGLRVVQGQRILQAESDIFLGWFNDEASGRDFYVRQLKNRRLGSLSDILEENALASYALLCARTLARAHARSSDPAVLAGYMGKGAAFDTAIADFALAYTKQNKEDHAHLVEARRKAKQDERAADKNAS